LPSLRLLAYSYVWRQRKVHRKPVGIAAAVGYNSRAGDARRRRVDRVYARIGDMRLGHVSPGQEKEAPLVLVSGIAVVDMIASGLGRVARPGELAFCSVRPSLGGHACNVASDLVRLGLPRSRLRVIFPAGRDAFGEFLAGRLGEQGIRAEPVLARKAPTSLDLILVVRGEDRRYHADPGANIEMTAAPVLAVLERHRPRVYYAGGVGLLGRFDADLAAVLKRAKRLGALTFVDVVSPYGKTWAFLRRALPWTDVFHCNADEAGTLVEERDPARAAAAITRLGAKNVLVTLGGGGCAAAVGGAFVRMPAFEVGVVDPTGAGDAFSAGIILKVRRLLQRTRGAGDLTMEDWKGILLYASACGAVCATGIGTTTAVRSRAVDVLIKRQGTRLAEATTISPAG
jgi:sugar/nucleoside kinase (ribokinase family)